MSQILLVSQWKQKQNWQVQKIVFATPRRREEFLLYHKIAIWLERSKIRQLKPRPLNF